MQALLAVRFQLRRVSHWDEQTQAIWWVDINEQ